MDLTLPYTLYPTVLPHTISWLLFILAVIATLLTTGFMKKQRHLGLRILLFFPVLIGYLFVSMLCGMVITFFIHDL